MSDRHGKIGKVGFKREKRKSGREFAFLNQVPIFVANAAAAHRPFAMDCHGLPMPKAQDRPRPSQEMGVEKEQTLSKRGGTGFSGLSKQ